MQILAEEKSRLLAEKNAWSLAYAGGFVEGEAFRRGGKSLSVYTLVGIDEYALGFRAGYFERQTPAFARTGNAGSAESGRRGVRPGNAAASTVPSEILRIVGR